MPTYKYYFVNINQDNKLKFDGGGGEGGGQSDANLSTWRLPQQNITNGLLYPRGENEKSFSPKLTDYFIQGMRKENLTSLKIGTGLSQK